MTGQVADIGKGLSAVRPTIMWVVGVLAILGLLYLIVVRINSAVSRWPSAVQETVSPTHCAEFIALAKAKYGADWKSRLDPRDTTCAAQVQQDWERQWIPRDAQAGPPEQSTVIQQAPPPSQIATRMPAAETYCLNVISLAKARYGADWSTKIDPADGKACGGQIPAVTQ